MDSQPLELEKQEAAVSGTLPHTVDVRRFSVDAARVLASSLDLETTLHNIVQLAVDHLADWCSISFLEQDGSIRRVALAHRDPAKAHWAKELEERYPLDPNSGFGIAEVLRTGRSQLMSSITDETLCNYASSEAHAAALRGAELRSAMVVPLISRGLTIGAISFVSSEPGKYTRTDLDLAEEFGLQAGLSVDNAQLYSAATKEVEERKRAEEAGVRAAQELRILHEGGRALGRTLDPDEVYDTMLKLVSGAMDCNGLLVSAYNPADDMIACTYAWVEGERIDPATLPPIKLNREGQGMQSRVIMTGEPILFLDVEERVQKKEGTYYHVNADGSVRDMPREDTPTTKSILMVPIQLEDKVQGVVQVMSHRLNAYTDDDLRVLTGLVLQMAAAGRNAALYQKAQMELLERRRAEDKFRSLVAATTSVVWSADRERRFVDPQPSWETYTGQVFEDYRGEGWLNALHPGDRERVRDSWRQALIDRPAVTDLDYRLWHASTRHYRHVSSRAVPLLGPEGEIAEWIGTVADIHQGRVSQERTAFLLALNDRIREIEDAGELLELVVCALGSHLGALRCSYGEVNDLVQTLEICGEYTRDVPRLPGHYRLHEDEDSVLMELRAGRTVSIDDVRTHPLTREGTEPYSSMGVVAFIAVPILRSGALRGILSVQEERPRAWAPEEIDLCEEVSGRAWMAVQNTRAKTEIVALNEELEHRVRDRTAQLEAANVEMEGFTYTVSHDLRAPLRAIMSSSMILLEDYGGSVEPEMRELLVRQAGAAKQLGILVDDLLKLSRLGRAELAKRPLDLSSMAREIAEELAAGSDASIDLRISEGLSAEGDPQLLRLALQNLIENSIKFCKPGQPVLLEIGKTSLDGSDVFYVRDQGIGFDQQYEHKIFEPFERLHRTGDYPGTGVGLANVKRVVERHGGDIWAVSRENEGATFYFTL